MKTLPCLVIASLSLAGLSACQTTEEKTAYAAPQRVHNQATIQQDDEYVARVEQIARRRGVDLRWVNPPTKRVASVDDQ